MAVLHEQLQDLASQYQLTAIYAFGSRAAEVEAHVRGTARVDPVAPSDLDVGVQPRRGIRLDLDQKVRLTFALERLFGVSRVDLVVCTEAPPFLAQEVVSGQLLCCTDRDEQAEYELYVLRRAGDLAPFEYERRRLILEEGGH